MRVCILLLQKKPTERLKLWTDAYRTVLNRSKSHLVKLSSGMAPAASRSTTGCGAERSAALSVDDSPATSTRSPACVVLLPAGGWAAGDPPWASDTCPFDGYNTCQQLQWLIHSGIHVPMRVPVLLLLSLLFLSQMYTHIQKYKYNYYSIEGSDEICAQQQHFNKCLNSVTLIST